MTSFMRALAHMANASLGGTLGNTHLTLLRAVEATVDHTRLAPIGSATLGVAMWQRLVSVIPTFQDVQLLAAPKKKVSPHRKGNRSANKHIRFIPIVSQCSKCERVFPPHAMPSKCDENDCPAFNLRERPEGTRPVPPREDANAADSSNSTHQIQN